MLNKLETRWNHLESTLAKTFKYMDSISPEQRLSSPEGKWNASQVLYHLMMSETGTRKYLEKKLLADERQVANGGIGAWFRSKALILALSLKGKKYKAPEFIANIPEAPHYEEMKVEMLENRIALKEILNAMDASKARKTYFKHPFAGRINMYQTLDFLNAHFERHAGQIIERSNV